MNDLISRSALVEEVRISKRGIGKCTNHDYLVGYMSALSSVEGQIAAAPAVDAVEVVRCKDCVWYQPNWIMGQDVCGRIIHNALRVSPNFFCQRGEREKDNNGKDN